MSSDTERTGKKWGFMRCQADVWTGQSKIFWPHSVDFNKPTKNQVIRDTWHMYLVTLGHLSRDRARLTWQGNIVTLSRADLISDSGAVTQTHPLCRLESPETVWSIFIGRGSECSRPRECQRRRQIWPGWKVDTRTPPRTHRGVSVCLLATLPRRNSFIRTISSWRFFKWCGLGGAAEIARRLTSWLRDPLKILLCLIRKTRDCDMESNKNVSHFCVTFTAHQFQHKLGCVR